MAGAARQRAPILSVAAFRDWLTSRPDEEHWELIGGVPMMMTPPTGYHQRIATNLDVLLVNALRAHGPSRTAFQGVGLNIFSEDPYDPQPDVVVVDRPASDERYYDRFYLVAEVLSESYKRIIASKRDIYRAHPSCSCILLIRKDRVEVTIDMRSNETWLSRVLHDKDELRLPEFGLICQVKALYQDTPLG
jgi:Uma2 family endonuclease